MNKILVTGAGTGLGKLMALALANKGYQVIATVHSLEQVALLKQTALENKVELTVEKLDISDVLDREKAFEWNVDVLINNAGIDVC